MILYTKLSSSRIRKLEALAEKAGARIRVIRGVIVEQNLEWQKAIDLAGTHTPAHYNVRNPKVGDQFPPVCRKTVKMDIVLLNYPQQGEGGWEKGISWGNKACLKPANPREVFGIGRKCPNLNTILGQDQVYVVAPIKCIFMGCITACFLWWKGRTRSASLPWVGNLSRVDVWFAFSS